MKVIKLEKEKGAVVHMQTQNEKDSFRYTYSASEQQELRKIQQKYQPQEESKMDKIRRMDADVTQKATMFSVIIGVIGALILGTGMSLSMTELGAVLGISGTASMMIGIVIGTIGIILVCLAYPVYNYTLKKEREKIAPEILRLTEELMK